ncbi:bifunctional chorismate mutase/prephenate dehydrogenase [Aliikangiella sp. G2MR2-5]|uniref:bifunctional chorismate mutase/prephenate dehydrogenase n=1 Tax=Aliikangiella sp. G2MR2-5 TaxID=2788943 RepID=UPI001AEEF65A|nr:bifunctional chorismate mutase/prephenate dehydrogenase [Aliikangiella sp. G2MR2-5]
MMMENHTIAQLSLEEIESAIDRLKERKAFLLSNNKREVEPCLIPRKIVVIGGGGRLGSRFVQAFKACGHNVSTLEKDDWIDAEEILGEAELVLISVPIELTNEVIHSAASLLEKLGRSDFCTLADITSIKQSPLREMMSRHDGPVLGLHPMFGPDIQNFEDQTIVVCHGRGQEKYQWVIDILAKMKARLVNVEAKKHDSIMAFVQVLRHFSTVAYGAHLANENPELKEILALSSPIYRLELAMVGRLFAQAPELYTEIIFANLENVKMMKRYLDIFRQLLELIEQNDRKEFKRVFLATREWFGRYASQFMKESSEMLAAAHEIRN